MYLIYLLYGDGKGSYLSIRGKIEWRTKRTAIKYARELSQLKTRTGIMHDLQSIEVQNEFGDCIKDFILEVTS